VRNKNISQNDLVSGLAEDPRLSYVHEASSIIGGHYLGFGNDFAEIGVGVVVWNGVGDCIIPALVMDESYRVS
jgi:hypothetical protein